MSITKTTTNIPTLKINYLTESMYADALNNDEIDNNQLYLTPTDNTSLIDLFYPVGSYYETSDTSFNPNTVWGGTWSLLGEGQVLLSAGSTYTAGQTYGSNTDTLTDDQVLHTHSFTDPTYTASGGSVADHAASTCTRSTGVGLSSHSITQPAFKVPATDCNGRHSGEYLSCNGAVSYGTGALASGSTYKYMRSSVESSAALSRTSPKLPETACTRSTNVAISDHTITQPVFTTPKLTHTVTNPTISVNTSGSVSKLGTAAERATYSRMQASTAVNIWHRTA